MCTQQDYNSFFFFFNAAPWHMEVLRPGTKSEPPLGLMPQLQQQWILNPLHQAGDQTCAATDTMLYQILHLVCHHRNSLNPFLCVSED